MNHLGVAAWAGSVQEDRAVGAGTTVKPLPNQSPISENQIAQKYLQSEGLIG